VNLTNFMIRSGPSICKLSNHFKVWAEEAEQAMAWHRSDSIFDIFVEHHKDACEASPVWIRNAMNQTMPTMLNLMDSQVLKGTATPNTRLKVCSMCTSDLISSIGNDTELTLGLVKQAIQVGTLRSCVENFTVMELFAEEKAKLDALEIPVARAEAFNLVFAFQPTFLLTALMLPSVYHKHVPSCGRTRDRFGDIWP